MLVLGQEQDERGGGFSATEAFVGNMTQLHVWDHVLSALEVRTLGEACREYSGTLYAWPDFLSGLKGRLKPQDTRFCKGQCVCVCVCVCVRVCGCVCSDGCEVCFVRLSRLSSRHARTSA